MFVKQQNYDGTPDHTGCAVGSLPCVRTGIRRQIAALASLSIP
jgi:hypothetical protein